MVRLYRRRNAGWQDWKAWPEPSGQLFVHRGRAGQRGVAERLPVSVLCAEERLARWSGTRPGGLFLVAVAALPRRGPGRRSGREWLGTLTAAFAMAMAAAALFAMVLDAVSR